MPNYHFECPEGHEFVLMLPMSSIGTPEGDSPRCRECAFLMCDVKAQRVIKSPAINFHPWRKQLADQPFEIDAIEQGVYEETYD